MNENEGETGKVVTLPMTNKRAPLDVTYGNREEATELVAKILPAKLRTGRPLRLNGISLA